MSRSKLPLSAPFPQVIFSDAQYTILPDVSAYRYPDKTVYVSTVSIISITSIMSSYRYPDKTVYVSTDTALYTSDETLYLSSRVIATKLILTIPTSQTQIYDITHDT